MKSEKSVELVKIGASASSLEVDASCFVEVFGAERPRRASSPSNGRRRSGDKERVGGRSQGGGRCLGNASGRDGVPPRVEGKKRGPDGKVRKLEITAPGRVFVESPHSSAKSSC